MRGSPIRSALFQQIKHFLMNKRNFKDYIEFLIEMEALTVGMYTYYHKGN